MKYIVFLLAVSYLLSHSIAYSQEWNLKVDKDEIQVYHLKNDSAKIHELKVVSNLNGTVKSIAQIILAIDKQPTWAFATKSARTITKVSETEIYFYKEINSPTPVSDRDLVGHLKVHQLTEKKAIIKVASKPTFLPEKKGFVRIPFSQETWVITAITPEKSKVEYYLKIDPGGSLPALLVNLFSTKGPFESFVNLRELSSKTKITK
jgi:hypothetical protein